MQTLTDSGWQRKKARCASYCKGCKGIWQALGVGDELGSLACCSPAAAAKSLQSCPTLCDCIDGNPPCSPVPGILQARALEWVAISSSNA